MAMLNHFVLATMLSSASAQTAACGTVPAGTFLCLDVGGCGPCPAGFQGCTNFTSCAASCPNTTIPSPCPPPPPPPPPPSPPPPSGTCSAKIDLVFLLDGSASIDSQSWDQCKTFVNKVVNSFNISANETRIGAVQFSSTTHDIIQLSDNKAKIKKAIARETQLGDLTATRDGLAAAGKMFKTSGRYQPDGKVLILLTDGQADPPSPVPASKVLKAHNITFIAVGIGQGIDKQELETLVSKPVNQHFFYVKGGFSKLQAIIKDLVNNACNPPLPPWNNEDEDEDEDEHEDAIVEAKTVAARD